MVRFGAVGAPVVLLPPEEQPLFRRAESDTAGFYSDSERTSGLCSPPSSRYRGESKSEGLLSPKNGYGSVAAMDVEEAAAEGDAGGEKRIVPHVTFSVADGARTRGASESSVDAGDFAANERSTSFFGEAFENLVLEPIENLVLEPLENIITETDSEASCHNPLHDHDHEDHDRHCAVGSASHYSGSHGASAHQHLKLVPLAILVFYNVSGGPFGIEESVRAGGNFYAILGFIIAPIIWSLPEALVTAEMGSAFPEAAGGVAWAEEAFGPRVGLLSGYLGWVAGATDNAIYPTLFVEYLTSAMSSVTDAAKDELASGWVRFAYVSGLTLLLAGINYTGLEIVGASSIIVCVLAMSPFIVMLFVAIPQIEPSRWAQGPTANVTNAEEFADDGIYDPGPIQLAILGGVLWRPFLNNLFWNLNSFDAVASFAGEVRDIKKTFPAGIFLGLALCVIFYLVPLLVATGATKSSQQDWVDGHMAAIATEIGGPWLGGWTVFAAGISNLALFEAEMSADAYQVMGMADRGFLPKIFCTRSRYGTPTYGILLGTIVIVIFSVADFSQLLEMLNMNYAISLFLEYAAFVKLRYTHQHVERPYRIPIPNWAAVLLVLPPILMIFVLFLLSSWITLGFVALVMVLGIFVYHLQQVALRRNWCEFAPRSTAVQQAFSMPNIVNENGDSAHAHEGMHHAKNDSLPSGNAVGNGGELFENEVGVMT